MRKTIVALLLLGAVGGLAVTFVSCGGTGGGIGDVATGNQFVSTSCNPGGSGCLTLSAVKSITADGKSVGGFRATLNDGSGGPITNIDLCFRFEDPNVATILEPTDSCGLTGPNGRVSGQFRAGTQSGSFQLICDAPPAFNLEARRTIRFLDQDECNTAPSDCPTNQFCALAGGPCGYPRDKVCVAKRRVGECCEGYTETGGTADKECVSGATCQGGTCDICKGTGVTCTVGSSECCNGTCPATGICP